MLTVHHREAWRESFAVHKGAFLLLLSHPIPQHKAAPTPTPSKPFGPIPTFYPLLTRFILFYRFIRNCYSISSAFWVKRPIACMQVPGAIIDALLEQKLEARLRQSLGDVSLPHLDVLGAPGCLEWHQAPQ